MSLIVRDDGAPKSVFEELLIQDRPLETLDLLWALGYWYKTKNPFYVDYVLCVCDTAGFEIGPLLQAELVNAASERQRRAKLGLATLSWTKVQRNLERFDHLTAMAILVRDGENQVEAADLAIKKVGEGKWKIETLVKDYSTLFKKAGFEKALLAAIDDASQPDPPYS